MAASCAVFTIRGRRTSGRRRSCRATGPRRGARRRLASRSPERLFAVDWIDPQQFMTQVLMLLALAFSILIAIFAVQNTTPVAVTFLTFHSDSVAVSVLVLISAALG